jgi:hypothetical protein
MIADRRGKPLWCSFGASRIKEYWVPGACSGAVYFILAYTLFISMALSYERQMSRPFNTPYIEKISKMHSDRSFSRHLDGLS